MTEYGDFSSESDGDSGSSYVGPDPHSFAYADGSGADFKGITWGEIDAALDAYHGSQITPEQAAAINDGISIEVYGGMHGSLLGVENPDPLHVQAIDTEYGNMDRLLDSLSGLTGDRLFIESDQHTGSYTSLLTGYQPAAAAEALQNMRASRTIDPFSYAAERALLQGVPVDVADMHRNVSYDFEWATGQTVGVQPLNPNWPYFGAYHNLRDQQTANTVKDAALHALPTLQGVKPTYSVLRGLGHVDEDLTAVPNNTDGLPAAFVRMGLHVSAYTSRTPWSENVKQSVLERAAASRVRALPYLGAVTVPNMVRGLDGPLLLSAARQPATSANPITHNHALKIPGYL